MKTKMAFCVYAATILLPLSLVPAGYAQSSVEQAPMVAPTTISDPAAVYLTNGSVLRGVEIVKIESQEVVLLGVPGTDREKAFPVAIIDKILFAQGEEHTTGIIKKNGDPLYGKIESYTMGVWTIALEGPGNNKQTFEGKGGELFRSINFRECCRLDGPRPQPGPKKRGARLQSIIDGTPLAITKFDISATWDPLKTHEEHGIKYNRLAEWKWNGYWYAPKTGQYVFTIITGCKDGGWGCFGSSVFINRQLIFQGEEKNSKAGGQVLLDLSEGYHPIEVYISMNNRARGIKTDRFRITFKIVSDQIKGGQDITPASIYHD